MHFRRFDKLSAVRVSLVGVILKLIWQLTDYIHLFIHERDFNQIQELVAQLVDWQVS